MSKQDIDRKLRIMDRFAIVVSVAVLALVILMRRVKIPIDVDFSFLPPFHAFLNSLAAVALLFALFFVRRKQIELHRNSIFIAIGLSVLFLLSYVVYHFTTEETLYCKEGTIRYVYFFLLITHVVLAGLILPFILFTFNRAWVNRIDSHRKLAKWVFPLWLYVTITGPVCYIMLKPCYG
jgi:putative membrane protein